MLVACEFGVCSNLYTFIAQSHFAESHFGTKLGSLAWFLQSSYMFSLDISPRAELFREEASSMTNFYTDVISKDARFDSLAPVRDLALLEPTTRKLVESLVSAAHQMGIEIMVFETYRSQNRQQELFNNGATKLRNVGVHHYGLACDIVRVVGGEPCWKGDFSFLGQLAHSSGLIWGGDWGTPEIKHSFIDSVHVQRCTVARQGDLFAGAWYPDDAYNPYDDGQHLFAAAIKQQAMAAVKTVRARTNKRKI
jgi:hypothetical protein